MATRSLIQAMICEGAAMTQADWWNRPTYSRVLTLCEHCGELKEGVEKRVHYWPSVTMVGCKDCFDKRIAETSGIAIC